MGNIRIFLPGLEALFHNYSFREQIVMALGNAHYELIHVDTGRGDEVFPLTNTSKRAELRQVNLLVVVVQRMKCS